MEATKYSFQPLAELHFHLGSSLEPHILWSIAHEQGIKLPTKDYWEFHSIISIPKQTSWDKYHQTFHWTELIQSSPLAMEKTVYEVLSGAYRSQGITLAEPLFNPMYRNRGGERDLDQIILAALHGMEKMLVEYKDCRAGLILALDRRLPFAQNEIIVKKAIKYRTRGVVGIDIAGPNKEGFKYEDYTKLFAEAREFGLKTSVHTGEDGTPQEMAHVLSVLSPDRVNHGIKAAEDKAVMKMLATRNITCCLCPTSNLVVGFIHDIPHLKQAVRTLYDNGVKFCFNTDNPCMLGTSLQKEIAIIRDNEILTETEIAQTVKWAFEATFIPQMPQGNLYL